MLYIKTYTAYIHTYIKVYTPYYIKASWCVDWFLEFYGTQFFFFKQEKTVCCIVGFWWFPSPPFFPQLKLFCNNPSAFHLTLDLSQEDCVYSSRSWLNLSLTWKHSETVTPQCPSQTNMPVFWGMGIFPAQHFQTSRLEGSLVKMNENEKWKS